MEKHYYSLNDWAKEHYGYKLYKLALDGQMTCPNRDGSLGDKGCIFCSANGSGDFTNANLSITNQLQLAKDKIKNKANTNHFLLHTFNHLLIPMHPIDYLQKIFTEAINDPEVDILSIATRPDCIDNDILELLIQLNKYKPVWIELGLQTIHEDTAKYIRRGYDLSIYDDAISRLKKANISVITHMIVGLPGESRKQILETARYIGRTNTFGIKIQLLHILEGTDLLVDYEKGKFNAMQMDEYIDILIEILQVLPPTMVIHRITGDGPKSILKAPLWSGNKKKVLNTIRKRMDEVNLKQGSAIN
ncbi:putative Fe-S oxidoreductase [Lachnospiraceae bacterium TWA4]|nr:putative Fe-S oxidoreductase [Lachnospiraceae bacterium TWA4]